MYQSRMFLLAMVVLSILFWTGTIVVGIGITGLLDFIYLSSHA